MNEILLTIMLTTQPSEPSQHSSFDKINVQEESVEETDDNAAPAIQWDGVENWKEVE